METRPLPALITYSEAQFGLGIAHPALARHDLFCTHRRLYRMKTGRWRGFKDRKSEVRRVKSEE
jgi:hypothetical protein